MRPSVWKVTTAAALGLAGVLAFRPLVAQRGSGGPMTLTTGAVEAEASPQGAAGQAAAAFSRSGELADKLRAARGTEDACAALDALGRVGDRAAAAAIVDALKSRAHAEVRECAVIALGHVAGDDATGVLVAATHEPLASLRVAAITALATRDDASSRSMVIAIAQSADGPARLDALCALAREHVSGAGALVERELAAGPNTGQQARLLTALGDAGDPAVVRTLDHYATSGSEGVRTAALRAAARLGGPGLGVLDAAIRRGGGDAVLALGALGAVDTDDARAALVRATDDPRPAVAAEALSALASYDGEDVRAAVVLHVGARDSATALAAARWLALRGDGEGVASLVDAARRPDDSAADRAVTALAGLDTDAAQAALLGLASRPGVARESALRQLADSAGGAAQARSIAIRMMRDEGGGVATTGLNVLATDESTEATRAIAEMARSGGPLAESAVAALGQRHDEASLLALVDTARLAGTTDLRLPALRALAGSSDPRAMRALVDAAGDPTLRDDALTSLARTGGPDAERALARAAGSADPLERAGAARALMADAPPALLPRLETLARDPNTDVADAAFSALREKSPASALALAAEGMHAGNREVREAAVGRAAQLDAEAARPLLLEALRDLDSSVVVQAAGALATAGGADAQQALLDVLTSSRSSDEARRAAAEALQTMGGAAARDHADLLAPWLPPDEGESGAGDDEG